MAIRFEPKEPAKPAKAAAVVAPKPEPAAKPAIAPTKTQADPELPLGASAKPATKAKRKRT